MSETMCKDCEDYGLLDRLTVEERDCDLCPRCAICDGRAAHHTDAAFQECFVEYTKLGWEVLPSERFWKTYVVPCGIPAMWRELTDSEIGRYPARCSACGRSGLRCCEGFGVGV